MCEKSGVGGEKGVEGWGGNGSRLSFSGGGGGGREKEESGNLVGAGGRLEWRN